MKCNDFTALILNVICRTDLLSHFSARSYNHYVFINKNGKIPMWGFEEFCMKQLFYI